jgi:hypothetical protein
MPPLTETPGVGGRVKPASGVATGIFLACDAHTADAAGPDRMNHHLIAYGKVLHVVGNIDDLAGDLVAKHRSIRNHLLCRAANVDIGLADACRGHAEQHLTRSDTWLRDLGQN